jgi:cyclic lactone autoinducer peptide
VKRKLFMLMVTLGVSVLTFFAFMASASACFYGTYQPEEPKCLREE